MDVFKAIAAASHLMGEKDVRAYINGVHITSDGRVWATNGHAAVSITVGGVPEWLAGKNIDECCIKQVVKAVRSYKAKVVHEMYETLEKCEDWLGVKLKFNGQTYPNLDRVLVEDDSAREVLEKGFMHGFDASYTMAIAKCCKELFNGRFYHVPPMKYNGSAYLSELKCAKFVLMPLRT